MKRNRTMKRDPFIIGGCLMIGSLFIYASANILSIVFSVMSDEKFLPFEGFLMLIVAPIITTVMGIYICYLGIKYWARPDRM